MKNLILSAAVLLSVSLNAAASPVEPVINEKAQKTFISNFKDADKVSWSKSGNHYEVYFDNDGIKTRATIDAKGALLQTVRYYAGNNLPATILETLKKDYRGAQVHGVTEVTNTYGVNYRIVLKDAKHYTHINANQDADTEVVARYKRADK